MKWRKFWEPDGSARRRSRRDRKQLTRRRVVVEALENRRLFAVDLDVSTDMETVKIDSEPADYSSIIFECTALELDEADLKFQTLGVDETELEFRTLEFDESTFVLRTLETDRASTESELDLESMEPGEPVLMTMSPEELAATSHVTGEDAHDVNGDGVVTAVDMLLVINAINNAAPSSSGLEGAEGEPSSGDGFNCDVNRNGVVSPIDVLLLVNYFNSVDSSFESDATQLASDSRLAAIDTELSDDASSDAMARVAPGIDVPSDEEEQQTLVYDEKRISDTSQDSSDLLIGDATAEDTTSSARFAWSDFTTGEDGLKEEVSVAQTRRGWAGQLTHFASTN